MTTKELIEHLKMGDPQAEVGIFDHFGNFLPMDRYYFEFKILNRGSSPQGHVGSFLHVRTPDIGPEPE